MTDAAGPRDGGIALAATLAIQVFVALSATATAVLAPEIARTFAVPAKLVGVFVGLLYAGSMVASLAAGHFIARYGAIRLSQVCVLISSAALCSVAVLPPAAALGLVLAPLVMGFGYGPITPASSEVLARTARPERMALTFSIKQTGVPAGAALAGAALPGLALAFGWRATLLAVGVAGILVALAAEPTRQRLDRRGDAHPFSVRGLLAPLGTVFRDPMLLQLSITGFCYAAMQMCLMSFLVVYLTEALGYPLIAAGVALTVVSTGGIVGRIVWGAIADRWLAPRRVLGVLGLLAGACAYATATFSSAWPIVAVLAVGAVFGATAIGWNGVQLAQVARYAPVGRAGAITGASGFITFAGVMTGPPLFAALAAASGSYRTGFITYGTLCLACGATLFRRTRA